MLNITENEKFKIKDDLIDLILCLFLVFKDEKGKGKRVPLKEALTTLKKVVDSNSYNKNENFVLLKEFFVDLRNIAEKESYSWIPVGVSDNSVVDMEDLKEEVEKRLENV